MSWLEMKVRGLREEAADILAVELCRADGTALPFTWGAGAHVDLQLGNGLVRQYSLTNLAEDAALHVAIKREADSRGGSRWLHEQLRIGSRVQVGVPRNLFPLQDGDDEVWLVAAGIGITPLLAMYRHCLRRGRPVCLLYFARSEAHLAFAATFAGDARASLICGLPADEVSGRLRAELPTWRPGLQLYTCGPAVFMEQVMAQAAAAGWPDEARHQEHFQAPANPAEVQGGFELVLARSGQRVTVQAGESLVAAAARVGVGIPTSCGMGMCGCCVTRVLSGTPEHRDQYLSDAEQASGEWLMPCVSGCQGARLELDC
ncbi:PDR/VanB family oxidoreductase [Pseudomonas sp. BMS12]|uniref:PDR/VanB family oxidoreductase n=1 Tax=Pseudomonas sp. BMS12 TaxID=1796033 RepID=UPI00083B2E73|nr:PDR/VanB family oxidoreductase [Pseudomonas sp. BMS12]